MIGLHFVAPWRRLVVTFLTAVAIVAAGAGQPRARAAEAADAADEEAGFVSLSGADGHAQWLGYAMDEAKGEWPTSWKLENGVIHCTGGAAGDLKTKAQYADCDFRFQWKISPGGNSGVMYRVSQENDPAYFTGPEYQILDDAAHNVAPTDHTASGSLYEMYEPKQAAAQPVGQWNDGRIVVRGNRIEHYLNGVKVVEAQIGSDDWNKRLAASKFSAWSKFGKNGAGHIVLQDHGNEVSFQRVRIKKLDEANDN